MKKTKKKQKPEPRIRYFRPTYGLFPGLSHGAKDYCIAVTPKGETLYPEVGGRIDYGDGVVNERHKLGDCLGFVKRGCWLEFDGDLTPWKEKDKAPAPPKTMVATKLVPWDLHTVRLNAVFRWKDNPNGPRWALTIAHKNGLCLGSREKHDTTHPVITWDELFSEYEHSIDGGKTWHPCGTEA